MDSRRAIEVGFLLTAPRCMAHRQDLGRIISQTTDNFAAQRGAFGGLGKRQPLTILSKKSLPWLLISGIPRPRAGTTNLLSTSNGIAFSGFQRRRSRAGTGAYHVRW